MNEQRIQMLKKQRRDDAATNEYERIATKTRLRRKKQRLDDVVGDLYELGHRDLAAQVQQVAKDVDNEIAELEELES